MKKKKPKAAPKGDRIFQKGNDWGPSSFVFDRRVVDVFDDMVERSVPGYSTVQVLLADLAIRKAGNGIIYDLGCSTGTTIKSICARKSTGLSLVGVDNSPAMVKACTENIAKINSKNRISIECRDLSDNDLFTAGPPSVVILCLVLQFVRPLKRPQLIQKIYQSLEPGGCLMLIEKTVQTDAELNKLYIDYYHFYKAEMGYSEIEIAQKREALENVLIPYTLDENRALLASAGFEVTSTFFQWMNFCGFVAVKKATLD